jgi:hypothetical protein
MKKFLAFIITLTLVLTSCWDPNSVNNSSNYQSTVTGTISGSVIGHVTAGDIWVEGVSGNIGTVQGVLSLSASYSNTSTKNQITITSPSTISSASIISSLGFFQAPLAGIYTEKSSATCGAIVFSITAAPSTTGTFAVSNNQNCNGGAADSTGGTYSLTLSTVTPVDGISNGTTTVTMYTIHGTLDALLPGTMATATTSTPGSVTLHLTF